MKMKSIPGGILGIVGGAFVLISGVIIFAQLMSIGLFHPLFAVVLIMYVAGGALGIVGGAVAVAKNNMVGGILQVVGVVFAVVGIVLVFSILAIISGVVLLAGMIITFAVKKPVGTTTAPLPTLSFKELITCWIKQV